MKDTYYFLFSDATTWFVLISGYLFSHIECNNEFSTKEYLTRKVKFVVTPYIILSIPAISAGIYFSRHTRIGLFPEEYIAWSLCVGGSVVGPLWFIPMIIIFFILGPLFYRIQSSSTLCIVTLFAIIFSLFSNRPFGNYNPPLSFSHFIGFYLLGMLIANNDPLISRLKKRTVSIAVTLALAVFIVSGIYNHNTEKIGLTSFLSSIGNPNYAQIGKLALLISIFLYFEKISRKENKLLSYFASRSFSLFFIHGFFMVIFSTVIRPKISNTFASIAIELALVFAGSIIITNGIKNILGERSRYVIGS